MITILFILLVLSIFTSLCAINKPSQSLRIMTYNLRYDNPGDGADNWKFRKDYIFSMLKYQTPDVFCIQEGLNNQVLDLAKALPTYAYSGVGRDDGKEAGEYSAGFYDKERFRAVDSGNFWLSATPDTPCLGWDAACIRICSWVKLADILSGKEVTVFNTHFDHVGKVARESSARLILERINTISKGTPVLLTGDFNAPDSDIVNQILTTDSGLLDSGKTSKLPHHGPAKTWFGFYPGAEKEPQGIDFIYASKGIKTLTHATLSEVMDNGHFPSDHLPVIAEIVLP
jgi:endonuclease/exonuclease/phosphatase family metal-dependent hydrolase